MIRQKVPCEGTLCRMIMILDAMSDGAA